MNKKRWGLITLASAAVILVVTLVFNLLPHKNTDPTQCFSRKETIHASR